MRLLGKLFIICISFVVLGTALIQNHPRVKKELLETLITLGKQELGLEMSAQDCSINLFLGKLHCYNCTVQDTVLKTTIGKCKRATISIGKLAYFLHKKINLYLDFYDGQLKTELSGKSFDDLDAYKAYKRIAAITTDAPIQVQTVTLTNVGIEISNAISTYAKIKGITTIWYDSLKNSWFSKTNCENGFIKIAKKPYIKNLSGTLLWHQEADRNNANCFEGTLHYLINEFDTKNKIISQITYQKEIQEITARSNAQNLNLKLDLFPPYKLSGTFPLSWMQKNYETFFGPAPLFSGDATIKTTINENLSESQGTLEVKQASFYNYPQGTFDFTFIQKGKKIKTKFYWNHLLSRFFGCAFFDLTKKQCGAVNITNLKMYKPLKGILYSVKPKKCNIACCLTTDGMVAGAYTLDVFDELTHLEYPFSGTLEFNAPNLTFKGNAPEGTSLIALSIKPKIHLKKLLHTQDQKTALIVASNPKNSTKVSGKIRYDFLKHLLPFDIKQMILGKQGIISFSCNQDNYNDIAGTVELSKSRLFLQGSYNLIEKAKTNFAISLPKKELILKKLSLHCFKGSISSPSITYHWNDDPQEQTIYAPFTINHLLINWKKDFYSFVKGKLLYKKEINKKPKITASLLLERSLLCENILSPGAHQLLFASTFAPCVSGNQAIDLELKVKSQEAVAAKTSFLQTHAHLDLDLKSCYANGALQTPELVGTITLDGGALQFLRNKLMITHGIVHFLPNRMNDPIIDFIAKNRIKKYVITLQATGSLQKPHITLESIPELTEEQILGLLLAGSENMSLQADLPAMLMQNLNTLLLGTKELLPKTNSFLRKVSKPLQYVQITPHFADQAGKGGGIKGTVAVDITPQFHIQIQKDFSLQEDLSFQAEYFLTDDFNIKAIRESCGDIKTEAEVRLKF